MAGCRSGGWTTKQPFSIVLYPVCLVKSFAVNDAIIVESGLAAHFKQPSGESRPGVDWAVRIAGKRAGTVIVRTYFSSQPPQETEKKALAEQAMLFIQRKLDQGWIPEPGIL